MSDGYLTTGQAAKKLGISDFTLRRRIRAGELPVFTSRLDKRQRLLPVAALEEYAALRPAAPRHLREVDAVPA